MTKTFAAAAALAAVLTAAPLAAMAGSVTLAVPHAGASLNDQNVQMNVYYADGPAASVEVVATYVTADQPDQPQRLIMGLGDGDDVTFALPQHPDTLYNFQRRGGLVTVTSAPADAPTS